MAHYFIAYDLTNASQERYQELEDLIESLGTSVHLQYSVFYLRSNMELKALRDTIGTKINKNEKLMVIDAKNCIGKGHGNDWDTLLAVWKRP
ncbi:CRISPR associated protein Cas2 [Achromobacter denitrificans]|uniref:CRISPR-associated endonuclease Cas2 n=1 Tax=Achromobacter denitrificans TaxID=32002 RepID=UPI000788D91B|nr:CRISPR-associated endonuclease Cas2 [Achromobacter denitrificans]OLU09205.1 hypothetical protein BVK87_06135 [Achromobacter denitrificans]QKH45705.1 CRISPR-associated endonuclease Cas2 [Achromobacter denitrificans]QKH52953.1 CRISPR-associated endonuclease Cas2 [Achromobacter denitrificans]CAB3698920.1 hypothetical protein LMG1231_02484 [Achromobacter denitrificans]SUW33772.1 CRISPR associated protein Cas2 [Achromobacter denitrificans]